MKTVSLGPWRLWVMVSLSVLAGAWTRPAFGQAPQWQVPECPHNWGDRMNQNGDSLLDPAQEETSLAKKITNVPEFHDCQRFVENKGGRIAYGPAFAVFGAWDLEARWDTLIRYRQPAESLVWRLRAGGVRGPAAFTASDTMSLPSRTARAALAAATTPTVTRGRIVALGLTEIYAEGNYAPLGIHDGFNCAYFFFTGDVLQAKMVSFGDKEPDCSLKVDANQLDGTVLQVRSYEIQPHKNGEDYPASARWEWSPVDSIQYFGVKCGPNWCEVGPGDFRSSRIPANPVAVGALTAAVLPSIDLTFGPTPPPPPPPSPNLHRVYHVKGWFDTQRLAEPGTKPIRIGRLIGTVFPDSLLDSRQKTDFRNRWIPAAEVTLDAPGTGYQQKLNLVPATGLPGRPKNKIELCWGSWSSCIGDEPVTSSGQLLQQSSPCMSPDPYDMEISDDRQNWWARITAAGGKTEYRCVRRRDHPPEPGYPRARGTARWRFRSDDDTIWMSCSAGCCEVET